MAKTFIRFNDVSIPPDSVITRAYVVFTAQETLGTVDANVKCYFVDEDNPSAPTSKVNLDSRSLTASIDWTNLTEWIDNRVYTTPDLSSILQTVVDRNGWNEGNSILFIMDDDSSDSGSHRLFSAIEFLSGKERAELRLSWEPPRQIEIIDFIPRQGAYAEDTDVSIYAYPSGCAIHYTLDGSDPDEGSSLFSTPLPLETSNYNYHIRARAYKQHWLPSDIYDAYYFTTRYVSWENVVTAAHWNDYITRVAIALDSNDKPHIAFTRLSNWDGDGYYYWRLFYTNKVSGSWSPLEVIKSFSKPDYTEICYALNMHFNGDGDCVVYFSSEGQGNPARLRRAVRSGGSWSLEDPISALSSYSIRNFQRVYTSDGNEHICFTDILNYGIRYVYRDSGGTWHYSSIGTGGLPGFNIDSDGYIHVVYCDVSPSIYTLGSYWRYTNNRTGSWVKEPITNANSYAAYEFGEVYPLVGIDPNGFVHIFKATSQYHPDALCAGVDRFNTIQVQLYKDDNGWHRKLYEDWGGRIWYTGYCTEYAYKATNFPNRTLQIMEIAGQYYLPIYVYEREDYFALAKGYATHMDIDNADIAVRDGDVAIDSNNNCHVVWSTTKESGLPYAMHFVNYGTTEIETRTYL